MAPSAALLLPSLVLLPIGGAAEPGAPTDTGGVLFGCSAGGGAGGGGAPGLLPAAVTMPKPSASSPAYITKHAVSVGSRHRVRMTLHSHHA